MRGGGGEEREREKKINRRSEREEKLADPVCVIDSMRFHEKSNLTIGVMSEKPSIFITRLSLFLGNIGELDQ